MTVVQCLTGDVFNVKLSSALTVEISKQNRIKTNKL